MQAERVAELVSETISLISGNNPALIADAKLFKVNSLIFTIYEEGAIIIPLYRSNPEVPWT